MKIKVSKYDYLQNAFQNIGYFIRLENNDDKTSIVCGDMKDGRSFKLLTQARRTINILKSKCLGSDYSFRIVEE